MKIRNGFVSNSSSSSFVVALDHEKPSLEYTKSVFGPISYYTYGSFADSDTLHRDTIDQTPILITEDNLDFLYDKFFADEALDTLCMLRSYQSQRYKDLEREINILSNKMLETKYKLDSDLYTEYRELVEKAESEAHNCFKPYVEAWLRARIGKYLFHYSYSDNDGQAALEHGGHWQRAGAMVFSHH